MSVTVLHFTVRSSGLSSTNSSLAAISSDVFVDNVDIAVATQSLLFAQLSADHWGSGGRTRYPMTIKLDV